MINIHSKYDSMQKNGMFNVFIYINNHVIIMKSLKMRQLVKKIEDSSMVRIIFYLNGTLFYPVFLNLGSC